MNVVSSTSEILLETNRKQVQTQANRPHGQLGFCNICDFYTLSSDFSLHPNTISSLFRAPRELVGKQGRGSGEVREVSEALA